MTEHSPRISVRGEATLEVEPEVAEIIVAVSARDKDRQRTLTRLAERVREVRAFLDEYGDAVERVESGRVRVQPEMREKRERRAGEKISGYSGSARIDVTVTDFTALGELMARLGDREMATVTGPRWALRPASEAHRGVRQQAARTAMVRAAEYADAVESRLTGLIELADVGSSGELPRAASMKSATGWEEVSAGDSSVPPLDLEPEMQVVRAAVEARFTISPPANLPDGAHARAADGTSPH